MRHRGCCRLAAHMPPDVSIVVADPARLGAIRDGASLPGRAMHFATSNLASAIESIRAYRPKVVAIDAIFAETGAGATFLDRIDALNIAGCTILLVVDHDGRWVTMPRSGAQPLSEARRSTPSIVIARAEQSNTRRAPRFLVRGPLDVTVENGSASLVDLSVLGAQVVSQPALRPRQKIMIALPDTEEPLNVVAQVAWSTFEKPQPEAEPHYRVGLEFTGAMQQTLEGYRQRHCAEQPIPIRKG
jgi:hypothetical protein